ncbi:hypothetical protein JL720_1159 [Aureococcus anophagefferens]|nr:hypothetical protein JL720_1159 [Aureococcus anophagefferens]
MSQSAPKHGGDIRSYFPPKPKDQTPESATNITASPTKSLMATWTVAFEFLPFEAVVRMKCVSKQFRSAARLVLTKGRYEPVARSLALVSRLRALPHSTTSDDRESASASLTEGDKANLRAAWSLEASIVVDAVARADLDGEYNIVTALTVNFLEIFEPTLDGFERIVAAMEHSDIYQIFFEWAFWNWIEKVDPRDLNETFEQQELRLWRAVESWDSPSRAFDALYAAINEGFDDWFIYASHAREMTAGWEDQSKRKVVIAKFQAVTDEIELRNHEQHMAENGWKYCKHGDKHWDCPECCDAWAAGCEDTDEEVQDVWELPPAVDSAEATIPVEIAAIIDGSEAISVAAVGVFEAAEALADGAAAVPAPIDVERLTPVQLAELIGRAASSLNSKARAFADAIQEDQGCAALDTYVYILQ